MRIIQLTLILLLCGTAGLSAQTTAGIDANPVNNDPKTAETTEVEQEEQEVKSFSLSGYVDAYYQANPTNADADDDVALAFPTSFTGFTNTFGIGNVNLLATKSFGKVGFVGQIGFGPRAVEANGGDGNFSSTVQQLYVTYSPSDAVTFTLGNFGTFVGYEVIDAPANMNYSTSYLFSNGPFYHTGAKVDFAIAEGFGAMVGIFNDTDAKIDQVAGKHFGGQLSFESGGFAGYLNALAGKEEEEFTDGEDLNEFQVDLTATFEANDNLMFGLNTSSYNTASDGDGQGGFFGTAVYSTIGVSESADISLRAEYFALTAPEDVDIDEPNVLSFTATGNINIADGFRVLGEVRYDTGSNDFLNTIDGDDFGENDEAVLSLILAGIYSF